ncbi:unnamed protein product [Cuscuta epithymum]|uniref:Uncharacterized protein n=1 Tax=Cuscuta epithymum TaxID=186058 RepID=A0AAV0D2Z1_9ASTE|nr:unnamed protein product [Cuscuta epithymum]CAH9137286.1 unnamed protein product [Cuscuta epithymum]
MLHLPAVHKQALMCCQLHHRNPLTHSATLVLSASPKAHNPTICHSLMLSPIYCVHCREFQDIGHLDWPWIVGSLSQIELGLLNCFMMMRSLPSKPLFRLFD